MSLEYASRGLVGMLTPQANTTVEPEFNILWPRGVAMISARLMSDKPSISARLERTWLRSQRPMMSRRPACAAPCTASG